MQINPSELNHSMHQILREAYEAITQGKVKLLSLDVFDTLLFRKCSKPSDIFLYQYNLLSAKQLIPLTIEANEWRQLRETAEKEARKTVDNSCSEVTLEEIYSQLPKAMIANTSLQDLIRTELEAEEALIATDPYLLQLIRYAASKNIPYICVSDNYLNKEQLTQLIQTALRKNNIIIPLPQAVFVSAEFKESKASQLFPLVLEQVTFAANEILHIGDNLQADGNAAKYGMKTIHYASSYEWQREIEKLEGELQSQLTETTSLSLGEGWQHLRRKVANFYSQGESINDYRAYGAFVYGPLFYGYSSWCLQKVKQLGIKKIFCFTRESHLLVPLLQEVAQIDAQIEAYPLAISRYFANLIAINKVNVSSLLGLFSGTSIRGDDFFNILGLYNEKVNLPVENEEWLSQDKVKNLLQLIINNEDAVKTITAFIEQQQEEFYNYLTNIGFIQEESVAICDLGGNGTIQKALRKFLRHKQIALHMTGLYLATTANALQLLSEFDTVYSYLIQFGSPERLAVSFFRSPELLENITMPAHGSLKNIENRQPIFSSSLLTVSQIKQAAAMQHGILSFTQLATQYFGDRENHALWSSKRNNTLRSDRDINLQLLIRSVISPTLFELNLFREWQHEYGLGTNQTRHLIPNKQWLLENVGHKPLPLLIEGHNMHQVYWLAAALTDIGGESLRDLFKFAQLEKIATPALENVYLNYESNLYTKLASLEKQLPRNNSTLYDVQPYLLHSLKNFKELILRILNHAQVKTIVVIGVEAGHFLKELCHYAVTVNGKVIAIDPTLSDEFIGQFTTDFTKYFEAFRGTSKFFFATNQGNRSWGTTAFLVDGDHNFATVSFELEAINNFYLKNKTLPLIFLHDTGWPFGHRDLNYTQGVAPLNYTQAQATVGLGVGLEHPIPYKGSNFAICDASLALREGGEENGVMAAIEAFIQTYEDYTTWHVPLIFGLNIIIPKSLTSYNEIANWIIPWTSGLLANIEKNRLEMYFAMINSTHLVYRQAKLEDQLETLQEKYQHTKSELNSLQKKYEPTIEKFKSITDEIEQLANNFTYRLNFKKNLFSFARQWWKKKLYHRNAFKICNKSYFFDANWYLQIYPDVLAAKVNPITHYLKFGAEEGRDPGPFFSTSTYLKNNPQVKISGINPLVHFERTRAQAEKKEYSYQRWIKHHDTLTAIDQKIIKIKVELLKHHPLISVLMPLHNPPKEWLILAIESVLKQLYPYWELCIAEDASTHEEIKEILRAYEKKDSRIKVIYHQETGCSNTVSNRALQRVTGKFIALLNQNDELAIHALYRVAEEINAYPDAVLIYSDEDRIDEKGVRFNPYFKSDWNPDLLLAQNYITHLGIYRQDIVRTIGGFREGYEGSQDYDLALRVIEQISPSQIRHIPQILYHWRKVTNSASKHDYAHIAARKAIQSHLERQKISDAQVVKNPFLPSCHRVIYSLPETLPLVSIIIPTKDKVELLQCCVESILTKTDYPHLEILIVDNNSCEKKTHDYFRELNDSRIKIIPYPIAFNYSKINNFAVTQTQGEILVFLNNDTEIISPEWLKEMLGHTVRPEIGIVGAKLYYADNRIQHAGIICDYRGGAKHIHRQRKKSILKKSQKELRAYLGRTFLTQNFLAVTGACIMMRRAVFEEIGGFDEALAVSFNDVALCFQAYAAGYRILWTPYASLYHHESATRGKPTTKRERIQKREEAIHIRKKWGHLMQKDPFYHPNLSFKKPDCSLASRPRDYSWLKTKNNQMELME
ncbi:glycosyltransferase [Legionella cardiaca]|uniref:Glycosyltransferase n=1 Tax=Legionella cardiaca TaxID=1071983 RepID=A0ABY8AQ49_9GAMM|nr:glycosyltransferase [Legionella cardiaca]WED42829.1 glycosyltransferase [Legionella cardiaca]